MKEIKLTREQIRISSELANKSSIIISINKGVGKHERMFIKKNE